MKWVLVFSLLLFTACEKPAESDLLNADEARIKEEIRLVFKEYGSLINTGNWDRLADLYSNDPRFHFMEDGVLTYSSKEEIFNTLHTLGESIKRIDFAIGELKITPLTPDLALVTTTYKQDFELISGGTVPLELGAMILLQKEEQGWKFLAGHTATVRNRRE